MKSLSTYKKSVKRFYRRSFSRGVGSVMSIPGNYFPSPDVTKSKDTEALRQDWQAVGFYIQESMNKLRY